MPKPRALITGITGQDGTYLARLLVDKGYEVHGVVRRSSCDNLARLKILFDEDMHVLKLHTGDLCDSGFIFRLVNKLKPDEIYNLAAQSHVGVSFESPEVTADVNSIGTLRLLESIRNLNTAHDIKFYQASTSELFGKVQAVPQDESTPFYPRSPYGVAKLYAYWAVVNYREAFDMYACNGILFNHESPLRGHEFVTKKITRALTKISLGLQDCLHLGNLDAKRDWGHARDFVEMQWLMLQQEKPDDFVIATGKQYSVRQFVEEVCKLLKIDLKWQSSGIEEVGIDRRTNKTIIAIDPKLFRPAEVDSLLGSSKKAEIKLGWKPKTSFEELVKEMVDCDMLDLNKGKLCV
jgi:GDPmannose 4,6-dehydratase